MANLTLRRSQNVEGDFFVDDTCIDCDACRQLAPNVFSDIGEQSIVYNQPKTEEEIHRALMALVTCPVASIGTVKKHNARMAVDSFPLQIVENIYFCGFNSEKSFGAWSYLIARPESEGGNILIDSPRFTTPLVKKIEKMDGIRGIFLSHEDDIADHARFAEKFGAERFMHKDDGAVRLGIENVIEGQGVFKIDEDFQIIPTAGHTRGSMVFLYKDKFLFTGDHLFGSETRNSLVASRRYCTSWKTQIRSMERLLDYSFEWVIPGHGRIYQNTKEGMREELKHCVAWMKSYA